jgi:hypothetical protein
MSSNEALVRVGDNSCVAETMIPQDEQPGTDSRKDMPNATTSDEDTIVWLTSASRLSIQTETQSPYPDSKTRTRKLPS